MTNVLIINGHHKSPGSPGALNAALEERAETFFRGKGFEVRKTKVEDGYDVAEEVEKFRWANTVFVQMPVNWLGTPWIFKKYVDEVWMLGLMGHLSDGDGRSSAAHNTNYGLGGKLNGTYMMSLTGNAPREAFNNSEAKFFDGMSEDDLFRWMHLNFKWIGLKPLQTFMAYDVMKNAEIENDFRRFGEHLAANY